MLIVRSIAATAERRAAMSQLTTAYWPADPSVPVLPATIGGILRATAERDGDRVALIGGDPDPERLPRWSYGELLAEAERAARALLTDRHRQGAQGRAPRAPRRRVNTRAVGEYASLLSQADRS